MKKQPYKHEIGIWIYPILPPGLRVAKREDFFVNGNILIGLSFIIHSFHDNEYEAHIVKPGFEIEKIDPWLQEGRIYVKQ